MRNPGYSAEPLDLLFLYRLLALNSKEALALAAMLLLTHKTRLRFADLFWHFDDLDRLHRDSVSLLLDLPRSPEISLEKVPALVERMKADIDGPSKLHRLLKRLSAVALAAMPPSSLLQNFKAWTGSRNPEKQVKEIKGTIRDYDLLKSLQSPDEDRLEEIRRKVGERVPDGVVIPKKPRLPPKRPGFRPQGGNRPSGKS